MVKKDSSSLLKLAVIWSEIPGYLSACLKILYDEYPIDLLVISNLGNRDASSRRAFGEEIVGWFPYYVRVHHPRYQTRFDHIHHTLEEFAPQAVLASFQWRYPESFFLNRYTYKHKIPSIGALDTPWQGRLRQHTLSLFQRWGRLWVFDAVWVPGERTAQYAAKLFGPDIPVWRGLYCADGGLFEQLGKNRNENCDDKYFLYVGRLAPEKGLNDLVTAYRQYREKTAHAWELVCVGEGSSRSILENEPGVQLLGFQQPAKVAWLMSRAGAFVLPSHYEPWGVVLHEAALVGLPIICSDNCGAGVELVQHGFNGLMYRTGNVEELAYRLWEMSEAKYDRSAMSRNSSLLAQRYSTDLWARQLFRGIVQLRDRIGC